MNTSDFPSMSSGRATPARTTSFEAAGLVNRSHRNPRSPPLRHRFARLKSSVAGQVPASLRGRKLAKGLALSNCFFAVWFSESLRNATYDAARNSREIRSNPEDFEAAFGQNR